MSYAITHDYISSAGEKSDVGIYGPSHTKLNFEQIVNHPKGEKFKMYDDDKELYYEGVHVGGDQFEPLDCFGMPNAGCTEIHYFYNGKFQSL